MIEIINFKKHYRAKTIQINDLKSTQEGLYLKGANGSGKTTLLKAMAEIIPYQGSIQIPRPVLYLDASFPLPKIKLRKIKDLLSPPYQTLFETWFSKEDERLMPDECSLGMLQKMRLCLGLSYPVKTILLDEPLRGLDEAASMLLIEVLEKESKKVVITSHENFNCPASWQITELT